MTDSKAPERIWATYDDALGIEMWDTRHHTTIPQPEQGRYSEYVRADLRPTVKPLIWKTGSPIASPVPYQIWSNNGGSGAPDDPFVQYENFMAFDPYMKALGEFELYEDAEQACEDHWQSFMAGNIDLAPMTPAQAAKVLMTTTKDAATVGTISLFVEKNLHLDPVILSNMVVQTFLRAIAEGGEP